LCILLPVVSLALVEAFVTAQVSRPPGRVVLLDQDGGVDDLLSVMMLLSMAHVDLRGIIVTPADSYLRPATSATVKILRLFGRGDVPVAEGQLNGVNPFPSDWRAAPYVIDALPILNDSDAPLVDRQGEAGHEFLARKLRESSRVTVLVTGPLTNLAASLDADPTLAQHIEEVVWMGGAINVPGNVRTYEHDGSAEWNAFWDPPAVARLWQTDIPITIFPLDATNHVPVSMEFLLRLARERKNPVADLAGQSWATTVGVIPAYEYAYYMWDTLATGYLGAPHLVTFRNVRTAVTVTGPSAGSIREVTDGGRVIRAAESVNVPRFHEYVLELFRNASIRRHR
jgi:purine nucleosidase